MGEKFINFKKLINSIFKSVTKHKVILIDSIIAAVFAIIDVYSSGLEWEDYLKSFLMATLFAIPATYITENFSTVKKYVIQVLSSLAGAVITYSILQFVLQDSYCKMYLFGITFAVICFIITLFEPKNFSKSYYANLVKNFMFTVLLCLVGILGSILLIYAFSSLIFEIDDFDELMESVAIIWGVVVSINLFVFYLFEKREEPSGKAFKIIFYYVMFPVYGILLLILYIYLLKALFTLSLPNGQVNWFVSFASVFYLVFYFILREYKDLKPVKLFYKYGSFVLIPLMCVQWPAYFIRLNSYGFTGWRYSSLIYNIFTVIFITFTFIKNGKYTKFAIPVLGVFILFASVTPLNLIDVAYRSQYGRLIKVLNKYEMMENNRLKENIPSEIENIITDDDRAQLLSSDIYIRRKTEHKKPEWLETRCSFNELYNIKKEKDSDAFIIYEMKNTKDEELIIDVKGYSTIEKKHIYKGSYYSEQAQKYSRIVIPDTQFDITDLLLSLKNTNEDHLICQIDENKRAYLYNIRYSYNITGLGFTYYSFDYYIMKK